MKFEQGVSILEILLVLVIASIVVVMSVRYIGNYKRSENIARLQSGVGQVMDALNEYYFINCNQSDFKDVSLQKYLHRDFLGVIGGQKSYVSIHGATRLLLHIFLEMAFLLHDT